jgi:hypothetical protein
MRYYPGICLEGLRKTSVSITDVLAKIQTWHFPITNLQCYHYTNPLDVTFAERLLLLII